MNIPFRGILCVDYSLPSDQGNWLGVWDQIWDSHMQSIYALSSLLSHLLTLDMFLENFSLLRVGQDEM